MKISIITINLNNCNGLKDTAQSVLEQLSDNFEYLIIDGNSSDGSKEYIEQISDKLTYWHSKNDSGIYDAMNAGIKIAKGEYLMFLNSGDALYDSDVINEISKHLNADIIYGDIEEVDGENNYLLKNPGKIDFEHLLKVGLSHQATFIKRDLFLKYGLYDSKLKICADWTFFVDVICKHNATCKYVPLTISRFNKEGISSLKENFHIIAAEKENHLTTHYSAFTAYYQSTEAMVAKYNALKNSRLLRIFALIFTQFRFDKYK